METEHHDHDRGHEHDHDHDHGHGHHEPVRIVINGQPHMVTQHRISYEEVVRLAFPEGPFDITYTVDYATEHGRDGTLTKGQSTEVHKEMSFNVIKSNRS